MQPLTAFNELPTPEAREELLACCAADGWADRVAAGRPYPDRAALQAAGAAALADLTWDQVRVALDAHPRIGERSAAAGKEAAWSRAEQSAAATDDSSTAALLIQANLDYERRFGHIFLICATGLSAAQVLAAARERLGNDAVTEQQRVRHELAAIAGLRLDRLVSA
jgi:2-oxo-4-hydroxy-4-carboxy-5-ureidoimidazoline decarboxylase